MIKLYIKGTESQARAALQRHRLDHVAVDFKPSGGQYNQTTTCRVPTEKQLTVLTWFCHNLSTPYPPGTLLLYQHEEAAHA